MSKKIQILRNFFPFADQSVLEVTHDGQGVTLHDAVVVPIDEAIRLGWIRSVHRDGSGSSYEIVDGH